MSQEAKKIFEDIYLVFFAMPHVSWEAKYRSFETMVENLPHPMFVFWEIVGITPAALAQLAAKDFANASGIQRCHNMSRRERGKQLFNRDVPLMNSYEFYYQHDQTILALKAENDLDNFDRSTVIPISNDMFGRHTYSVGMGRKAREYLAKVHAAVSADAGEVSIAQRSQPLAD
jgi:hypothetical protein